MRARQPSFDTLTSRGRTRRLFDLARLALTHYDVDAARLRLLANHGNAVFRVDLADGTRRVLRVCNPTWRSAGDLEAELFWLQALQRDVPTMGAPVPLANRAGSLVTPAATPGIPEARRCVLFSWVPGQPPAARLTHPSVVAAIGEMLAHLHAYAANLSLPNELSVRRNDAIFLRGEAVVFDQPEIRNALDTRQRRTLDEAMEAANAGFEQLLGEVDAWHLINADLWQANVMLDRGQPRPIDFEDTLLGHPTQNVAQLWYDLLFYAERARVDLAPLLHAFIAGYTRVQPWPVRNLQQVTAMMLAGRVWTLNWVLAREPASTQAVAIDRLTARMRQLLDTDWQTLA